MGKSLNSLDSPERSVTATRVLSGNGIGSRGRRGLDHVLAALVEFPELLASGEASLSTAHLSLRDLHSNF